MKSEREVSEQLFDLEQCALSAREPIERMGFASAANALRWALGLTDGETIEDTARYLTALTEEPQGSTQ